MSIKIVKLTPSNIGALTTMLGHLSPDTAATVTLTKTTATFDVPNAVQALDIVTDMQARAVARFGATGHPNASLHAVRRKVETLAADLIQERIEQDEAAGGTAQVDLIVDGLGEPCPDAQDAAARLSAALSAVEAGEIAVPMDAELAYGRVPVTNMLASSRGFISPMARPVEERRFRARPSSHVAGRLLARSKCRRNRRG